MDLSGLLVQVFDLVVLPLLDNTDLILVLLVLGVVVLDDLVADRLFDLDLLFEVGNLISELSLIHLLLAFHAGDGTGDNSLHVLDLELRFRLRLVDILFQLGDVLDTLLGLSRELLVVLLQLVLVLLDLIIAVLLFFLQLVKAADFLFLSFDLVLELNVLVLVFHLLHQILHLVYDLAAVILD